MSCLTTQKNNLKRIFPTVLRPFRITPAEREPANIRAVEASALLSGSLRAPTREGRRPAILASGNHRHRASIWLVQNWKHQRDDPSCESVARRCYQVEVHRRPSANHGEG